MQYMVQQLKEYKGKKLQDATKADLQLLESEEEKKADEEEKKAYEQTLKRVKDILGERVEKVTVSHRVVSSPCVLVTAEFGWSANMERIMKAQALRDTSMTSFMLGKKTLELNPQHRIVRAIKAQVEQGQAQERTVKDLVFLLYDTALLTSGFTLPDPATFAQRIHKLVGLGLGVEEEEEEGGEKEAGKWGGGAAEAEGGKKEVLGMPGLIDDETVMEEVD